MTDIAKAILTIKSETGLIQKTLADAEVGEHSLMWTLTQEDTLALQDNASIMLNYVTRDGIRGASDESNVMIKNNHINEVI